MLFSKGLSVPEGPVALKDGSWLVVEMGPDRGCITQISRDGKGKRMVAKTGRPNGLAVDRNVPSFDRDLADADAQALVVLAQAHLQRVQVGRAG